MKIVRRPRTMEATRWEKVGDHPLVEPLNRPHSLGGGPHEFDNGRPGCGKPYGLHGTIIGTGYMVCPGDWVIESEGSGVPHACHPDTFDKIYMAWEG